MKRQICIQYSSDCFSINICEFGAIPEQAIFQIVNAQISVDEDRFLLGCEVISVINLLWTFWGRLLPQTQVAVCQATQHFVLEDTNLKVIFCHHLPYIM
jgi:hypothetical protein